MNVIAEIEDPVHPSGWKGWIVVEADEEHVSFKRDYQKPGDERRTWHDEGIEFPRAALPQVLEALTSLTGTEDRGGEA